MLAGIVIEGEKSASNGQVELGELSVEIKVNRGLSKTVAELTRPSEALWAVAGIVVVDEAIVV